MPEKSAPQARYQLIDALRGFAILMMFVYHFSFDLNYFGFIRTDFYHNPFWLNFRTLIVSTFLGVMGMSLHLAHRHVIRPVKFMRRLAIIVLCAALVSLSSYLMFPRSMIFFGILHFIALASVFGLPFTRLYWSNLVLGVLIIIAGNFVQLSFFNHSALQWIGMMTHKPITEDYVPLLPWFGVVLIGIFIARWADRRGILTRIDRLDSTAMPLSVVKFAGRHSLIIYMVHQPVFIGILYVVSRLSH